MNELERLAERGDERGALTVFERASHGPVSSDRSARPLVLAGAAVVIVVAVLAGVVLSDVDDPPQDLVADVPPPEAVFYAETNTTLVFDDGGAGVTTLDLDTGERQRRDVHNRAGDQPYRLHRTADRLVVGWEDVWSTALDGSDPVELGAATVFVPAVEDGSVWLVDYPGGRVGSGTATLTRVDVATGAVLDGPYDAPGEEALPVRAVGAGMAYEDSTTGERSVRSFDDGAELAVLGRDVGDVRGSLVVWAEAPPGGLHHITDIATGADVTFSAADDRYAVNLAASAFSPDGRTLAVESGANVLLVDVATGSVTVAVADRGVDAGYLAWSDDGSQLFWSSSSYGTTTTRVGRYEVATGDDQHRDLAFGGLLSFVAVPTDPAEALADDPALEPVHALIEDARNGTPGATAPIGPFLRLLLGHEDMSGLPPGEYVQPSAWGLGDESVLELLATPDLRLRHGPVDSDCLGGVLPEPTSFSFDDRVTASPVDASCDDWFALEVFLAGGEIVAIALVRNQDTARAEQLAAFARGDGPAPPVGPEVRLLLGREEQAVRTYTELQSADGWVLDVGTWGAFVGSFSALEQLAGQPPGDLDVAPGPLRAMCAGSIVDPPALAFDTAVTITPANIESCLEWFAVELFVANGQIVAVALSLSEP